MNTHSPKDYICPICLGIQGIESEDTLLKQNDLVYKDELVSVFVNSFWIGVNKGHVIVVPNIHLENLYEIPNDIGARLFEISKKFALILKEAYKCDGITLRQNNEPAGDQHAFHYHQHIYPRYKDDNFNKSANGKSYFSKPEERLEYAEKLKVFL